MDSNSRQQYRQTNGSLNKVSQTTGQSKMNERRRSSIFPSFLRSENHHTRESLGAMDSINLEACTNNEPIPSAEFYEVSANAKKLRPTYDDLHQPINKSKRISVKPNEEKVSEGYKMGWVNGVWIRTLLNIWGVELFLRMGWMVGQSGLVVGVLQIVLSTAISLVTTLSMSAICTNGKIGTGGTYYMISRSLGVEAGAMIGTITYFSMCVLNSLNIVGAAEGVIDIIKTPIIDGGINDVRLVSIFLLMIIAIIPLFGMGWEAKTHWAMFCLLVAALFDYAFGTIFDITPQKQERGLTGWNMTVIKANLWPDYQYGEDFYSVIAVFFPMVTGIFAGSGMSGDLRDPSKAIPRGTIWSIVTSSASYILVVIFLGCSFVRYGDTKGNLFLHYQDVCANPADCPNGLVNDYHTMTVTSLHRFLIYAGIFISAISSSLAVYVAAPRMFQAFSRDRLFPYVEWFGKGHGKHNEPYRGYIITFTISLVFCLVGRLNSIAPIISTFKLASFFLVNITCFHASYINSPSFRPSFRYYNKWLSLLVGLFCLVFMFFLHWDSAIITIILSIIIFVLVNKRSPKVNWGSTTEDQVFTKGLSFAYRLNQIPDHVKNYRPSFLLLAGNPSARLPLVQFASSLSRKVGLLQVAHVGRGLPRLHELKRQSVVNSLSGWLKYKKVRAFYVYCEAESLAEGTRKMLQLCGIGKMKANVLMMGFKQNWHDANEEELVDYYNTISVAFEMQMSIAILRAPHGLDFTGFLRQASSANYSIELTKEQAVANLSALNLLTQSTEAQNPAFEPDCDLNNPPPPSLLTNNFNKQVSRTDVNGNCSVATLPYETNSVAIDVDTDDEVFVDSKTSTCTNAQNCLARGNPFEWPAFSVFQPDETKTPSKIINEINRFGVKQLKNNIDVWWLYDDGGLTLLLPYILSKNKYWSQCTLRVFTLVPKNTNYDPKNLKQMLKQFRIPFSDVFVIQETDDEPSVEMKDKFKGLLAKYMTKASEPNTMFKVTTQDLLQHKYNTCKILKIRELLEIHSKSSSLIVMTLPIIRMKTCPIPLHMAMLDIVSCELPPVFFVRGAQQNVLTFYL